MAARRKFHYRHPKTTQERRNNQDKHDPLIRPSRRNKRLPNDHDDEWSRSGQNWKLKRKTQYRTDKEGYCWREYTYYSYLDEYTFFLVCKSSFQITRRIQEECDRLGFYYKTYRGTLYWYGTDLNHEFRGQVEVNYIGSGL